MPGRTYRLLIPEYDDFPEITFTSKEQVIAMAEWLCERLPVDQIRWYRDDYFTLERLLRETKNAPKEDDLRLG